MTILTDKAAAFAIAAHDAVGQIRKYSGEPYHTHCQMVASIVRRYGGTLDMIAAAWLHDVLEDTKCTVDTLQLAGFSDTVIELVVWLTKVEVPGNRATRKAAELKRLSAAPADAQTIKCADLLHNLRSIAEHDQAFAKVWVPEAFALHRTLTLANHNLRNRLENQLDRAWAVLGPEEIPFR